MVKATHTLSDQDIFVIRARHLAQADVERDRAWIRAEYDSLFRVAGAEPKSAAGLLVLTMMAVSTLYDHSKADKVAVGLLRRVVDGLADLADVEPKHLGARYMLRKAVARYRGPEPCSRACCSPAFCRE